jgi:predicted acetyltransferase
VDDHILIEGADYNIGYFFVSRRWRGQGVAQFVASALLSHLPGQWQIFHVDANRPAQRFWARIISELSGGEFTRQPRIVDGYPCTFYGLRSPSPAA